MVETSRTLERPWLPQSYLSICTFIPLLVGEVLKFSADSRVPPPERATEAATLRSGVWRRAGSCMAGACVWREVEEQETTVEIVALRLRSGPPQP